MSLRNFIFTVCALAFFIFSCDPEALTPALNVQGDSGYTYSESRSQWLQMKEENGNSYEYTIGVISWTGDGNNTVLTIEEGKVVARKYEEFFMDPDTGVKTYGFRYSETGAEIGAHEKGAKPMTMDALYGICLAEYLVADPDNNTVYFNTDGQGIMTTCGFVPDGCADDCFVGINLFNFKWV
jgi:hypothetical protein